MRRRKPCEHPRKEHSKQEEELVPRLCGAPGISENGVHLKIENKQASVGSEAPRASGAKICRVL